MKTKYSLPLGFVLGVATILLMGQSKPATGPVFRYTMVTASVGICVMDTTTGAVRVISTDPRNAAQAKMEFGQAFSP